MNIIEVIDQGFDAYLLQARNLLSSLIQQHVNLIQEKLLSKAIITKRSQFRTEQMINVMMKQVEKILKKIKLYFGNIRYRENVQDIAEQFRKKARENKEVSMSIQKNMDKIIYGLTEKALQREELRYRIEMMGSEIQRRPMIEMNSFFSSTNNEVASINAIRTLDKRIDSFKNEQLSLILGVKKNSKKKLRAQRHINPQEL